MSPAKSQPALLGGLTIGVLSALPVIGLGNCCCCAWILFGGGLAAYLMQQNHAEPITTADGAVVGFLAGAIGAVTWMVVSIPVNMIGGPFFTQMVERAVRTSSDMPPEARRFFEMMSTSAAAGLSIVFAFFVLLCVSTVMGTLGGIFGSLMFRRDPPPPVIPPIPPFGSGPTFTPPTFTPPPPPSPPPPPPAG